MLQWGLLRMGWAAWGWGVSRGVWVLGPDSIGGEVSVELLLSWVYFGWGALFLEGICGVEEFYKCLYAFLGAEYV